MAAKRRRNGELSRNKKWRLDPAVETAVLAAGEQAVERVRSFSRQPRFQPDNPDRTLGSLLMWVKQRELQQVAYSADSRARDQWLRTFWHLEPHFAGVLNSVIQVDSNRGWTLTGGRNQVYRYTDILHESEAGEGWRTFIKTASLSYHTSDMGTVVELGRDGPAGPMRAMFNVDPVCCRLTGNISFPLEYWPASSGKPQRWAPTDFFRVVSMPSNDETMHGLGFCSTSRAVEIVSLLYSVLLHDEEKVGARMPQGLLLLSGISEEQWRDALLSRKADLDAENRARFGGVMVLAQEGLEQIDARLFALSSLPDNFNRETFLNQCMYAYALCFGYDPREFWPVSGGQLGSATETEVQHMKATGKGGLDFVLSFQERLQRELPDTIDFEFEQRDDAGSQMEAAVAQAWADVAKTLYEAGATTGQALLDRRYTLSLLADHGIIPPEWTELEEETKATDTVDPGAAPAAEPTPDEQLEAVLENERVQRAMRAFPDEPIVRYTWPSRRIRLLYDPAKARRLHPVPRTVRNLADSVAGRLLWLQRQGHTPDRVHIPCPLCGAAETDCYADHKGLHVCPACHRTFDPKVE